MSEETEHATNRRPRARDGGQSPTRARLVYFLCDLFRKWEERECDNSEDTE